MHSEILSFERIFKYLSGEDTCFTRVRTLPPDAELVWSPGAALTVVRSGGYWMPPPAACSREVAIRHFDEALPAAIPRLAPPNGKFMMPHFQDIHIARDET